MVSSVVRGTEIMAHIVGKQWIFATTNSGKVAEAASVAARYGVSLVGLNGLSIDSDPPVVGEVCDSYQGNACLKASRYAAWCARPCVADDSGVEIEELGGLPGLFTARFGSERVLSMLGRSWLRYRAEFVCAVAYVEPAGRSVAVTRRLAGTLDPRLPLSPGSNLLFSYLFIPDGERKCLAQLLADGGFLSHRGLAFSDLCKVLL